MEAYFSWEEGPVLAALSDGQRVLLVFMRHDGDAGFASRPATPPGPGVIRVPLSNGQIDEYPFDSTVALPDAIHAVRHFLAHRERSPFIVWHDDST